MSKAPLEIDRTEHQSALPEPLQITQAVFGVFHHFELARELHRRSMLKTLYSTWPWARLKREGLPKKFIQSFPWLHVTSMLLPRFGIRSRWLDDELGVRNALAFDEWTYRRMPPCDAFIAISGAGLKTGRLVQSRGGKFICDRGSTHQRYQEKIVREEYERWGNHDPVSDIRDTLREEEIYETADAITVPSTAAKRSFIEYGVPNEKIHVIPYGVRLENFAKVADPPADRFEVLYAGSVSLRKGFPYLLQAFAQLSHPNKRLRVVGAIQPELAPLLPTLPTDNVEFLGIQPQIRLKEYMSGSHVMVLPSIEEGLALVQAQALACGCPVIASTNTGSEDLYTDGEQGFIVPVRDPDALRDRMQQLADDPAMQQEMSAKALELVKQIGGWSRYGDRWVELLQSLTAR